MNSIAQELMGCEAFSRDGDKIGKVKEVISDPESASECLVIKAGMFRELVVPLDVVEREGIGGRVLTVPLAHAALSAAPRVATKGELSRDESAQLKRFYHPAAD